jgi:hypothetical protein
MGHDHRLEQQPFCIVIIGAAAAASTNVECLSVCRIVEEMSKKSFS